MVRDRLQQPHLQQQTKKREDMSSSVERKPRFQLKLQIIYDDGQSFMSGPVADMSETGVFIETVMPLEPGTRVRLMPLIPDELGMFEFEGVVVRKADYDLDNYFDRTPGMGVSFADVSPDQRIAIDNLLIRGRSLRSGSTQVPVPGIEGATLLKVDATTSKE